jgi:DNA-binding response OmpR family regulator
MAEKILIVDDDIDTLRMVGMLLERQGYAIVAASNGQQGLTLAKSEKPDLILLDLMMPDIDGIEIARRLREDPDTQRVLIIMFTAKGQMEDKLEGFDAGADDYMVKPTQPKELLAHVRAVLKRASTAPAVPAKSYPNRGHVVGMLAAKGGVGVSTLAVNTAFALREQSKKSVILSDFRPGCGSIGLELGLTNTQGFSRLLGLSPMALNPSVIEPELIQHTSGVSFLLSSAQPQDAHYISATDIFEAIARDLSYLANYTLLDLGVSLTPLNQKVLGQCNQLVLVIEPVAQTIQQSRLMLDYFIQAGFSGERTLVVLVNRIRAGMQLSLGQVQDQLERNASVIITASPELAYQAQVNLSPMILRQPDGINTQQFNSLAQKIILAGK